MKNSQIIDFLSPNCQYLKKKITFFAIFENWSCNNNLQDRATINKTREIILKKHSDLYYHSLFHLFTCCYCFDRSYDVLHDKVHPCLAKLVADSPGLHIQTYISQKKIQSQKASAYYFCLFWNKLKLPPQAVINFHTNEKEQTKIITTTAAGITNKFPDRMAIPIFDEEIHLSFETDPINDALNISVIGGTPQIRQKIVVTLFFISGETQILEGAEIAIGGVWSISGCKASEICLIDLHYKDS